MEHLVAIMLLVGCGSDGTQCREIPVPTPIYASVEECRADLGLQMRFSATHDTQMFGNCTAISEDLMEQSATVEWVLSKGGELQIYVEPEAVQVADADNSQLVAALDEQ